MMAASESFWQSSNSRDSSWTNGVGAFQRYVSSNTQGLMTAMIQLGIAIYNDIFLPVRFKSKFHRDELIDKNALLHFYELFLFGGMKTISIWR